MPALQVTELPSAERTQVIFELVLTGAEVLCVVDFGDVGVGDVGAEGVVGAVETAGWVMRFDVEAVVDGPAAESWLRTTCVAARPAGLDTDGAGVVFRTLMACGTVWTLPGPTSCTYL